MAAADLLPGDYVQARMKGTTDTGADQWLVTEFHVTTVAGTVVNGSVLYPNGLDETAGWGFELIARALALPAVLSEITAVLYDGSTRTLMGKGAVWADVDSGLRVTADEVQSFTPIGA